LVLFRTDFIHGEIYARNFDCLSHKFESGAQYFFQKLFPLVGKRFSLILIPFRTDFIMRGIYASARSFDCLCR